MNMTTKRLTNHRYSNCYVVSSENGLTFVSYGWYPVIAVDADGWMTFNDPHYSATTAKQTVWFLREYFPTMSYQMVKWLYNGGMTYNIKTGEVKLV